MQSINTLNYTQSLEENPSKNFQNIITPLAQKIHQFAINNKGSFFLLSSFFFALAFSPEVITWNFACNVVAYSFLSFSSLQIFTTLLGRNELISQRMGEHLNGLLGVMNFCISYLFPEISLSSSLFNASIGVSSLFMRKLTQL